MNHQNQMFNHPREICTTQREDGKVLFKARNAARYLGHAGSDIALPETVRLWDVPGGHRKTGCLSMPC